MSIVRNSLAVVAASTLLALTSACGGADKVATCTEATKAMTDYQTAAAAAGANFDNLNKATADFSSKLKELAGKADGDLQSALQKVGDSFAELKIDPSDPAAATKVTEFAKKASEGAQSFAAACA